MYYRGKTHQGSDTLVGQGVTPGLQHNNCRKVWAYMA